MVEFEKSGCIRANRMYSEKMFVFGESGFIWAKLVVIGQNWLYSGKAAAFRQSGCIRQKQLYSGKVIVFGQKWCYSGKVVVFG